MDEIATEWSKPTDLKTTERSLDIQLQANATQELVNNYKKLLGDIRSVISEQRSNISKKTSYGDKSGKSHYSP